MTSALAKWGFIDRSGSIAIEPQYDYVQLFSEGKAEVVKDQKRGFVNTRGQLVVEPTYDEIYPYSEDFAAVRSDDSWGFIDHDGEVAIPLTFSKVTSFRWGRANILRAGRQRAEGLRINRKGQVVP